MPYVLRKVANSKFRVRPDLDWLKDGDLQADALKNLATAHSTVSVYKLTKRVSRRRIVAGLASTNDRVTKIEYVLLELDFLFSNGYEVKNTPEDGNTKDKGVNCHHYDIVNLSPRKLYDLARYVARCVRENQLIYRESYVARFIENSIESSYIDRNELKPGLREDLETYRTQ